ncbi:MAG: SH3 domain-containing protein [Treponema sp.]|nr:SH3 domain-containing protein [Treponema sp.]
MKKLILIITMIFTLGTSLSFADKARFYENGKVIDTMYVDSPEGLRVRDNPSLKSNRICGLTHRLPVKVVAIGKEETIDGITAPWVEILIPRYEWKKDKAEFGWVFGGYLSEKRPKFIAPRNSQELKDYLCAFPCWSSSKESAFHYHFSPDGEFWCGAHEHGEIKSGTYSVSGKKSVYVSATFDGSGAHEPGENTTSTYSASGKKSVYVSATFDGLGESINDSGSLNIEIIDEHSFVASGSFTGYHDGATFSGYFSPMYNEDFFRQKYVYNDYGRTLYTYEYEYLKNLFESKILIEQIKSGVSAEGSDYEKQYHDYWDPIMAVHQWMADAMK